MGGKGFSLGSNLTDVFVQLPHQFWITRCESLNWILGLVRIRDRIRFSAICFGLNLIGVEEYQDENCTASSPLNLKQSVSLHTYICCLFKIHRNISVSCLNWCLKTVKCEKNWVWHKGWIINIVDVYRSLLCTFPKWKISTYTNH